MRTTRYLTFALLSAAAGCGDAGARATLSEPETISTATTVGAAPMFAVSPSGKRAAAWISAPGGLIRLGVGAEFAVADNLTLNAEYNYPWGPNRHVGKVGFNWHF